MDSSVLGTGRIVLAKANAASRRLQGTLPLPPGCAAGGCTVPDLSSCIIPSSSVRIDSGQYFFSLQWAPPSGSPADLPLVFTYKSDSGAVTELGEAWGAPYHRFAEAAGTINPAPVTVHTPTYAYSYANNGSAFSTTAPDQES